MEKHPCFFHPIANLHCIQFAYFERQHKFSLKDSDKTSYLQVIICAGNWR